MSYIWPLVLIVVSNSIYHICAKSLPAKADPFAALTITYFIGTVFSAALYFLLNRGSAGLVQEWKSLNWTPYVLGFIVVAIEAGNVYAYRAGWSVNTLPAVQSACVAVLLLVLGFFCCTTRPSPPASSSALPAASRGFISSTNELCRARARGMIEENAERKRNVEL